MILSEIIMNLYTLNARTTRLEQRIKTLEQRVEILERMNS